MQAVIIGPLALPAAIFTALLGFLAALLVSLWWQKRGQSVDKALWIIALTGLAGARLGFLWLYQQQYGSLLAALDIRDGGWWWPGALAALPVAFFFWWRRSHHRPALLSTLAAALIAITLTQAVLQALKPTDSPVPDITLYTLEGNSRPLREVASGTTVVNLWASWCPPCRREMPILEAAQSRYPEVRFILANQGESAARVRSYLTENRLRFDFLLLDPHADLGRHAGNRGLPLTLLFDADGNELDRHFGPLSEASLHHFLSQRRSGEML
ncbi:MAG: TlpA family protein disulfide reductase [Pseudomonadales bacterium]|nr:TlpA family protein disulfide reductase [Pseudomonadales bacterium]